jgi:hypothetical protein
MDRAAIDVPVGMQFAYPVYVRDGKVELVHLAPGRNSIPGYLVDAVPSGWIVDDRQLSCPQALLELA